MRKLYLKQLRKNAIRRPIILLACAGISWGMIPWLYLAPPGFLLGKPISIYAALCLAIGLACLSSLLLVVLEKMAGQRPWAGRLTNRAGRLVVITFVTTLIALPYALSPLAPSECAYKSIIVTIANAQGQNCSRTCTNWEAANCGGWSSCFNKNISCEGGIDQNGRKCQGCCFDCKVICEPTDNPPSITGSLNCDGWGNAGWCRSNARLLLTTSDPQGYETTISGNLDGAPFTCGSSCELDLSIGTGVADYTVTSATSGMTDAGSTNWAYDPELPSVGLDANGVEGENGWYISGVTVTAVGSDSVSGIAGLLLSVDGGAWQPAAVLGDGVHTVDVSAQDEAGNVATASTSILVDTLTPNLSVSLTGTLGSNGWYTTPVQVTAIAGDDGSGLASLEVATDGGGYVAYAAPVSLMEGYHTYQFLARDNAGNLTETPLQELSVDAVGPAIHLPAAWQLGQTVTYDVQENSSELAALRVVIEDEDERWPKVAWNESVSGSLFTGEIDWNGKFKDGTPAPPGEYYATVKVSDAAGNESWKTGRIIVPDNGLMQIFSRPSSAVPDMSPVPPEPLPVQSNPSAQTFGGATNPSTPAALTHAIPVSTGSGGAQLPLPWAPIAAAAALGASAAYVEGQRKGDHRARAYRQIGKLYQQAMAEKQQREQAEKERELAEQEALAAQEALRREDKARTALGYAWLRQQAAEKEMVLQSVASKVMPAPAPIQGDPPPPPTFWDKMKMAASKTVAKVVNTVVQAAKAAVRDVVHVVATVKNAIAQAVNTGTHTAKRAMTFVQEKIVQPVQQTIGGAWENTKRSVKQAPMAIGSYLAGVKDKINNVLNAPAPNPDISAWQDVQYQSVAGQLFIQGSGDPVDIDPSDINQNGAPDCGFMSSLAEIAIHDPDFIRNMIRDNGDGTYTATFYRNFLGRTYPVQIRVDGEIPLNSTGVPPFAGYGDNQGNNEELWVPILEKAYAVYNSGSYAATRHWGSDAIEHLTGQNSQYYDPGKLSMADLARIHDQFQQGYSVTATSLMDPHTAAKESLYQNHTLVPQHEYYIVDITMNNNDMEGTVTLRNPWGWYKPPVTLSIKDFTNLFTRISTNPIVTR